MLSCIRCRSTDVERARRGQATAFRVGDLHRCRACGARFSDAVAGLPSPRAPAAYELAPPSDWAEPPPEAIEAARRFLDKPRRAELERACPETPTVDVALPDGRYLVPGAGIVRFFRPDGEEVDLDFDFPLSIGPPVGNLTLGSDGGNASRHFHFTFSGDCTNGEAQA